LERYEHQKSFLSKTYLNSQDTMGRYGTLFFALGGHEATEHENPGKWLKMALT
jgi:hypothetical protein